MSRRSRVLVPEAREALNRFKMEAANEVGVTLNQGYNGDKTSRENGSVGGQMVNLMMPEQQWKFQRINRNAYGHCTHITLSMVAGLQQKPNKSTKYLGGYLGGYLDGSNNLIYFKNIWLNN